MKLGKRGRGAEPGTEPTVVADPPAVEPVPVTIAEDPPARDDTPPVVVEGDAVELPPEPSVAQAVSDAPAAGSAETPKPPPAAGGGGGGGPSAPSMPQPVMELAEQRPEAVVGAAFVGGLLLAAILRRLGN